MIVDILIILFLISSLIRGREIGLVRQAASAIGFFGGLFLGSLVIQPHVVGFAHSPVSRAFITLAATLGTALIFLAIFEYLGALGKIKLQRHTKNINKADGIGGTIAGGITLLLAVWLIAPIAINLPFPAVSAAVGNSSIVRHLENSLPSAPDAVAKFGHIIEPNGFPQVFSGIEPAPPQSAKIPASLGDIKPAVKKDQASVVKIYGNGCGGIVEGSGFVVSKNLVATNAHVVAGIAHPYVIDKNGKHRATPIWFDPNLDFAVLRVNNLAGSPLKLRAKNVPDGTRAAVLGYPGGGAFTAGPASVLQKFLASGRNIYNTQDTERYVYELKAKVRPGNSGGPIINQHGTVIAVTFAESTKYPNVGYALAMQQVIHELHEAESQNHPVSTGICAE
jgi:S1-C subfamily serine protease